MIPNFYEKESVKKYIHKTKNPNFDKHRISVNSRILWIGGTGAGKTNSLFALLNLMTNTFDHIHLCSPETDEPLYQHLQDKIPPEGLTVYNNITALPPLDELAKNKKAEAQHLIIFDDCITEKKALGEKKLLDYFIRSRKKNCTVIFLSQDYYTVPKLIRGQITYLILLKLNSEDDLKLIMRNYKLGLKMDELVMIHQMATQKKGDFLKIDIGAQNKNEKFSRNFNEFFKIE